MHCDSEFDLNHIHLERHEEEICAVSTSTTEVVSMLQDADSGSASQKDLVQHLGDGFAAGESLPISWERTWNSR